MICAQSAIIPTNSVSDANAAASSTKIFNIAPLQDRDFTRTYAEHCSFFVLTVKPKNPATIHSVNKWFSRYALRRSRR